MDSRALHKRLYDAMRRLVNGERILIAVSGGADSMALLNALHAVNQMRSCGWRLHVAHLDHGLRSDSQEAAAFVERAAEALGVPCKTGRVDISTHAGESMEEAARTERYRFLEAVADEIDAKTIAVAHHADDQAETVLHRLIRGTGLRGLAGMSERRPIRAGVEIDIVRPLLFVRRDDLIAYNRRHHIDCVHDATNDDVALATRNRIRHEFLPRMRESLNPEVDAALVRLSEQASHAADALRTIAVNSLADATLDDASKSLRLDASVFSKNPRAIQTEMLVVALERLGVGRKAIGAERLVAAAEIAHGDGRRRRIELAGGVCIERRGRALHIQTPNVLEDASNDGCPD